MLNQWDTNRLASVTQNSQPTATIERLGTQGLALLGADHPERAYAEAFIQEIFFSSYQARITSFYPWLFSITEEKRDFTAVAGVRSAAAGPLFLKRSIA